MTFKTISGKKHYILISIGIFVLSLLILTVPNQTTNYLDERQKKIEAAKKEMLEAEEMLKVTLTPSQMDKLHLRIVEISIEWDWNTEKILFHLQGVSDDTVEKERLCSLLWKVASRLQMSGYNSLNWEGADWDKIKPMYERILRVAPESDFARRALYQLGHYYLAKRDFLAYRKNREEFIRCFSDKQPFYAKVSAKEIGDSFLFEGNLDKAQGQYENVLFKILNEKETWIKTDACLRLLQISWVKSIPIQSGKTQFWKKELEKSLGKEEYLECDISKWLEQVLKENREIALKVPVKKWIETKELYPYEFTMKFYKDIYDHTEYKPRKGLFDWFNKEGLVKRKVDKAKLDMRTIATALECYIIDYCAGYPPLKLGGLRMLTGTPDIIGGRGEMSVNFTSWKIEEPRVHRIYLRIIPLDPFGKKTGDFYYYYTGETRPQSSGWILISRGPDSSFEIDPPKDYDVLEKQPSPKLLVKSYDSTNGTFSVGDIFRVRM